MRFFLRRLFQSRAKRVPRQRNQFHTMSRMSSASTSAALYAVVSSSQATEAVPEETKELRHHLKHGKGFTNPWDSYREMTAFQIGRALIWYVLPQIFGHTNILQATSQRESQ